MPITTGFTNSLKLDHLVNTAPDFSSDVIKFVLILAAMAGTYDKRWTNAGTPGTGAPTGTPTGATSIGTDAVAASGDYTPRSGMTLTFTAPAIATGSPDKAITGITSDIVLANTNFNSGGVGAIRGLAMFNFTKSNKSIWLWDFGIDVTTLNGTLTLDLPVVDYANAMFKVG